MPLEAGDFINDLVNTNPLGSEVKSLGDDHLRLIKKVVLASFPDVDQAVSTVISSTVEPPLFRKGTIWLDETLDLMKVRNKGDSAWVTMALSPVTSNSVDIDAGTIDGVTITTATIEGGTIGATTPVTTLDVDNININGNTIISTNTDGDIVLDPDGTGDVTITSGDIVLTEALALVDGRDVSVDGTKLDGVEALADVTNTASVDAAGAVMDTEFNANTIMIATTDDTPVPITIAEQQIIGRITAGAIKGLTVTEMKTLLSYGALAALNTVSSTEIDAGAVGQTEIATAAVGQGELITTTGEVTATNQNVTLTLAGGSYGFYLQIKETTGNSADFTIGQTATGTYATKVRIDASPSSTGSAQQRYIQASPPYFLGAIQIPTFIFAMIENGTGNIIGMYQAADPPWANNGPTDIRGQRIDRTTGKRFRTIRARKGLGNVNDPDFWSDTEVEITPDYKNSDMGLIPHPFIGNDLTGKTIVMIDPRMKLVERLHEMIEVGESPLELFHAGDIRIGNNDIPAVTGPNGVMCVNATLR